MREQQSNDQKKDTLNYSERTFLAYCRSRSINPPSEADMKLLDQVKEQHDTRAIDVSNYLDDAENVEMLTASIHCLLGAVLYYETFFDHPNTQRAYTTLYHFNSILLPPPPEML